MRGRELPLVLLALVLCQAPRGPAAPVPAGAGTVLDKMYPRGNHWAVALSRTVLSLNDVGRRVPERVPEPRDSDRREPDAGCAPSAAQSHRSCSIPERFKGWWCGWCAFHYFLSHLLLVGEGVLEKDANPNTSRVTDGVRIGTPLWEEVRLTGHGLSSSVLHILCQRNPELGVATRVVFIVAKRTLCRVPEVPGVKSVFGFVFTGHLMGKKSTGESPYVYEGRSLLQHLQEYMRWEEAARNLLSLLEAKGTRSHQSSPPSAWDYQDDSSFKILGSKPKGITHQ
ncbi:hypothetical protein GH733_001740, partial [Mirounga leonina]